MPVHPEWVQAAKNYQTMKQEVQSKCADYWKELDVPGASADVKEKIRELMTSASNAAKAVSDVLDAHPLLEGDEDVKDLYNGAVDEADAQEVVYERFIGEWENVEGADADALQQIVGKVWQGTAAKLEELANS